MPNHTSPSLIAAAKLISKCVRAAGYEPTLGIQDMTAMEKVDGWGMLMGRCDWNKKGKKKITKTDFKRHKAAQAKIWEGSSLRMYEEHKSCPDLDTNAILCISRCIIRKLTVRKIKAVHDNFEEHYSKVGVGPGKGVFPRRYSFFLTTAPR